MTDIVERLRFMAVHGGQKDAIEAMNEAADEVERLRDALKAIECHSIDHTDACRMAGRARRAPEPKP